MIKRIVDKEEVLKREGEVWMRGKNLRKTKVVRLNQVKWEAVESFKLGLIDLI